MNKLMTAALAAGGLLLLNSPEAAAHKETRYSYQPAPYYHYDYHGYRIEERRSKKMPRWLKRNDSFRSWYKYSSFRNDRWIPWGELFEIYRWERRQGYYRESRRYDYYRDYDNRKHRKHRKDRKGHRDKRRHRH